MGGKAPHAPGRLEQNLPADVHLRARSPPWTGAALSLLFAHLAPGSSLSFQSWLPEPAEGLPLLICFGPEIDHW